MQGSASQLAAYRIMPTILIVPLGEGAFAVHRGTKQADSNIVVRHDANWKRSVLEAMRDGRSTSEISNLADDNGLAAFLREMESAGVIVKGSKLDTGNLSDLDCERYSRNLNGWSAITSDARSAGELQESLVRGHVVLFGLGGLGSTAAIALALAGVGQLTIIDPDFVELSNLNRQQYAVSDVGAPKALVLQERLTAINPAIRVTAIQERIRGVKDCREILAAARPDVATATADRPAIAIDRWINDACFEQRIPYVNASVSAGTGLLFSKVPGATGCFECDELWGGEKSPEHFNVRRYREEVDMLPKTSAFSFGAMAIGAMIAAEAVRAIVRLPLASGGKLIAMDFATFRTSISDKLAHPDCSICGELRQVAAE
jgi:molybdopterin/thiamine biosynthesis adenylyltransferase